KSSTCGPATGSPRRWTRRSTARASRSSAWRTSRGTSARCNPGKSWRRKGSDAMTKEEAADKKALESFDRKLLLIDDYVEMTTSGEPPHGLYLFGSAGLGKSYSVVKKLKESGAEYKAFNSRITAAGLFHVLKGSADACHVLDDVETVTDDK